MTVGSERFMENIQLLPLGGRMIVYIEHEEERFRVTTFFVADREGKTASGLYWSNSHIGFRQNSMLDARDRALPYLLGRGVDLGCGIEKVTPDCVGVDSGEDYGKHTVGEVRKELDELTFQDNEFDWVFSSNALEHVARWETALDHAVRILRPGGYIFFYLPWAEKNDVHSPARTPNHKWCPSPSVMREELEKRGVEIIECDDTPDRWACFCIAGRKHG